MEEANINELISLLQQIQDKIFVYAEDKLNTYKEPRSKEELEELRKTTEHIGEAARSLSISFTKLENFINYQKRLILSLNNPVLETKTVIEKPVIPAEPVYFKGNSVFKK